MSEIDESLYLEYIGVHLCPKCLEELRIIRDSIHGWIKRVCHNCNIVYIPGVSYV